MSFKDIFRDSFLDGFAGGIDVETILVGLAITTVIAVYIFFVYRLVTREAFYSQTFNLSLIAMAVITAAIILTIQSNIVLSLGMVGALSIVRFRTAIKDPLDLVFLYWSISVGIICGAGLSAIAVALTLIVTAVVLLMQRYPARRRSMIVVVNSTDPESDKAILETIRRYCKGCKVRSKNLSADSLDMIVEVSVDEESELVHDVLGVDGVTFASILTHDGEITA